MLTNKEWDEFYKWCKSNWGEWRPDKTSVRLYLEWQDAKLKNINWNWDFKNNALRAKSEGIT